MITQMPFTVLQSSFCLLLAALKILSETHDESIWDDDSTQEPFVHSLDHDFTLNPKVLESLWGEAPVCGCDNDTVMVAYSLIKTSYLCSRYCSTVRKYRAQ